jgi:hypothetical protein
LIARPAGAALLYAMLRRCPTAAAPERAEVEGEKEHEMTEMTTSNCNAAPRRGLARALAASAAAGLMFAGAAFAQGPSTGNPKGSVAPSTQGSSASPPAERARTVDTGRSDPLDSSKGPAEARTNRTPQPGGGSSTGGLTRRNPQDNATSPAPPPSNSNSKPGK